MQVGRYTLEGELARGGQAVVYRGRDPGGQVVAVKVLLGLEPQQQKRFQREIQAWSRLAHPGITRLLEAGEAHGRPYLAMELCPGGSLEDRLTRGPLPPREAVGLIREVALALDYAHECGVLHRDLKPANVLLDAAGRPKLTDFGLARDMDADQRTRLSKTGMMLGTPGYWPPEQAAGEHGRVGPASDVYALGATLYALLTGRAPFQGDSLVEVLIATASLAPEPPSALNPDVDAGLEALVLRCLAKEPGERPPSARAVLRELARWQGGSATAPAAGRPGGAPLRVLLAGAIVVGAGVLAGTILALGSPPSAPAASPSAVTPPAPSPAATSPTASPSLDPEAERWRRVDDALRDGNPATAAAALKGAPESAARTWVLRGRLAQQLRQEEAALPAYERACELDPGLAEAWARRGCVLLGRGRTAEAADALERAAALDPSEPLAAYNLPLVLLDLGRPTEALEAARKARALRTGDARLLAVEGVALNALGRLEDALRAAEGALAVDPGLALALDLRGRLRVRQGRLEEGLADLAAADAAVGRPDPVRALAQAVAYYGLERYREALEAVRLAHTSGLPRRDAAQARALEGELELRLAEPGSPERASRALAEARQLDPGSPEPDVSEARAALAAERFDRADALLKAAQAKAPDLADVWLTRGELEGRRGRLAEAEAAVRRGLRLRPELAGGWTLLVEVLRAAGREADVPGVLEEARRALGGRLPPELVEPAPEGELLPLAELRPLVGEDPERAARALEARLAREPDHPEALALRGLLRFGQREMEPAIADLRRALAVEPRQPDALVLLPLALRSTGRSAEALPIARLAVEVLPEETHVWTTLAELLLELGPLEEARQAATRGLELADQARDQAQAQQVLGSILARLGALPAARDAYLAARSQLTGRDPDLDRELAAVHLDLGEAREALPLLEGQPDEAEVRALRGRALLGVGRLEEADRELRVAILRDPTRAQAMRDLAAVRLEQGNWQDAGNWLRMAARRAAPTVDLLVMQAAAAVQAGELEEAERLAREAVALQGEDPEGLAALALVRRRRGDEAEAAALEQRAAAAASAQGLSLELVQRALLPYLAERPR